MVGKTLGKYRILDKIGRGGMGVVYRGIDETLDREVAIKAISPELVEDDLVRRFRAEAVTLAKVNHPNIASVYELFRDDDRLLMVMELVRGQTFEQLITRGRAAAGRTLDGAGRPDPGRARPRPPRRHRAPRSQAGQPDADRAPASSR